MTEQYVRRNTIKGFRRHQTFNHHGQSSFYGVPCMAAQLPHTSAWRANATTPAFLVSSNRYPASTPRNCRRLEA